MIFLTAHFSDDTPTLDIHGHTTDEGSRQLETFLNQHFLRGSLVVKIVHGIGSGRLQEMTQQLLDTHPLIDASHRLTEYESSGATYALLAHT